MRSSFEHHRADLHIDAGKLPVFNASDFPRSDSESSSFTAHPHSAAKKVGTIVPLPA